MGDGDETPTEWADFGKRLKARRLELGMTQWDLAMALRLNQVTKIQFYETGRRTDPHASSLVPIARALKCSVDYLLTGRHAPPRKKAASDAVDS